MELVSGDEENMSQDGDRWADDCFGGRIVRSSILMGCILLRPA